jgi:pectate disaccharide-lyase
MTILKKRTMAMMVALAFMFSMLSVPIVTKAVDTSSLIANQLEAATITANLTVGNFTIAATNDKPVVVDGSDKTADDGTTFTKRIKLGGTGDSLARSIHFKAPGSAKVTVYAMSASSSADRKLVLYAPDGTKIDEMDAPGANIAKKTFEVEAGDYYLASTKDGINVYGITMTVTPTEFETFMLDASKLTVEELSTSKIVGGFTITAASDKKVAIDANDKTAGDGTAFTKRIKLGGAGTADYRSIHFAAPSNAKVTVYAMSSTGTADRKLALYDISGASIGDMVALGASLSMHTFNLKAGDYYLTSLEGGINVYGIKVEFAGGSSTPVERLDWAKVEAPAITDVQVNGNNINVNFTLVTGNDGADKAEITMYDSVGQVVETKLVGKSSEVARTATFTPEASGSYTFKVEAFRNDVEESKKSEVVTKEFSLPLVKPVIRAMNNADGTFNVKWNTVKEAESYLVEYRSAGETAFTKAATVTTTEAVVLGLKVGTSYELRVTAVRGNDTAVSEVIKKILKAEQEREWAFTYFGQSISSSVNKMEMVDPDAFTFKLNSCTVKSDGVTIDSKGGKFTTFHDGISYYYTKVNPKTENFELTATFKVDYINSTPDGQEGFGLLAMDNLGAYGVSSVNHYTNSAGLIATKFEETIDGVKYTGKDTLGARFVSNITKEVLNGGDSAIAANGKNVSKAYSYAPEDLVQTGDVYTLTLKKTNTGYHAIYNGKEYIMYGVDKLLQLDKDNIYVGFAVARGCNVTVSNVKFTTSNPATDPPAEKEPVQLVPYTAKVDSPATTSQNDYKLVYVSEVPGTLTVKDATGKTVIAEEKISAKVDFTKNLVLSAGKNNFTVEFTPEADYIPGENQRLVSYDTVTTLFTVEYRAYAGSKLYVSPMGTPGGKGTKELPLDIYTATQFARNGQVIELAGGVYNMTKSFIIARGNDGSATSHKVLKSAAGERAVLNFANAGGGMQVWGNYWLIENIDVTATPGNIKGLQVSGNYNRISGVNAYNNGDTGIQISGASTETIKKWPSYNLILNCTSYDNIDPGMNNADGFAAKLTVGEGNVFRGCIAHNNLDDGWDLFAKIESGPIGAVTIENSVAYNNGTLTNGVGNGDGNGFKLGGDGISVPHKLVNSISYNNNSAGITSNSNPAVIVENSTSYGNKGANITLYGKGETPRTFVVKNVISIGGKEIDNIKEMPSLASNDNYFWSGSESVNGAGNKVDAAIFNKTDVTMTPKRDAIGSILMNGLLEVNDKAPQGIGAVLGATVLEFNEVPVEYTDSVGVDKEEVKDFTITSSFNLNHLEAEKLLDVKTSVANNMTSAKSVMVIVALFDGQDKMINISYISKNIAGGTTEQLSSGFKLPSDVTNHLVKVFVWNGTSLTDTTMEPLSDFVIFK